MTGKIGKEVREWHIETEGTTEADTHAEGGTEMVEVTTAEEGGDTDAEVSEGLGPIWV